MKLISASLALAAAAILVGTQAAHAQIIVYNSTTYVSNSQNLTRTYVQSGNTFTISASDIAPLSPAADYTGPTFFGGASSSVLGGTGTTGTNGNTRAVQNDQSGFDRIATTINIGNSGGESKTLTSGGFIYFKTASPFAVTANDQFSAFLLANNTAFTQLGRFLVRDGTGNLFVSNETFALGSAVTSTALTTTTFAQLNTAGPSFYQTFGTFGTLSLTGLTGAGVYYEGSLTGVTATGTGTGTGFRVNSFTVVPEPSTFAMLLGGAGMLALMRRRAGTR